MAKRKIVHRGKFYERTQGTHAAKEKAFADEWERENTRATTGSLTLSLLCTRQVLPGEATMFFGGRIQDREMTQGMATDAATIIQWLGSNVGYCFLEMALDRVGLKIVKKEAANDPR